MAVKRASGILLPLSSLPGKYGIGCFSGEAYRFIDFLKNAGQAYWQILPVGPTGYGDSPYQSFSAFAGNPYFLSLDALAREGLLTEEEAARASDPRGKAAQGQVDYEWLYHTRYPVLRKAFARWRKGGQAAPFSFEEFVRANAAWLPDFALFMALKEANGGTGFREWERAVRMREAAAMAAAKQELREEIDFHMFLQYQFELQWMALRAYANENGIHIIGDIPIYVPADSADVWANPELFQLHDDGSCRAVAGCPPDCFSETGQLWGNPLYDWDAHRETGYSWWISRMRRCSALFDVVRIDHFRGFDQYYSVPAGSPDACIGHWEKGPGIGLFHAIEKELPGQAIIAEDLGFITDSVRELVQKTGYPNMKVLEFAFDARDSSGPENYLPFYYEKNCVVYTGTHDNETLVGWLDSILPEEREAVRAFTGLDGGPWAFNPRADRAGSCVPEAVTSAAPDSGLPAIGRREETFRLARALVRAAMASVGDLCVIPMQDWLLLGNEARVNRPSTTGGNWIWRMEPDAADRELAAQILQMTKTYGRLP